MLATRLVQVIDHLRGSSDLRLVLRLLTVQHAQRILLEAHLAILAALAQQWAIVIPQDLDVLRAAVTVADAIDENPDLL